MLFLLVSLCWVCILCFSFSLDCFCLFSNLFSFPGTLQKLTLFLSLRPFYAGKSMTSSNQTKILDENAQYEASLSLEPRAKKPTQELTPATKSNQPKANCVCVCVFFVYVSVSVSVCLCLCVCMLSALFWMDCRCSEKLHPI